MSFAVLAPVLMGLGLGLVIEGLALALAPRRMEDVLRFIASLRHDQRRMIGLAAMTAGVVLIWLVRG